MDGFLHVQQRSHRLGALFAEDFDAPDMPEAAPEAEVIEPTFSADELANARESAWRDGHEAGLQEAATADAAATRRAVEGIAGQVAAERDAAATQAEQSAEAIARLLLDSLAAAFPSLCERHGDAEAQAVVRVVLPALSQEPAITIRAHPRTQVALEREIGRLDPDLAARVHTIASDAVPPGDVRVAWHNGSAARNAAALWEQVAAVLLPAGLLDDDAEIREMMNGN